MNPDVSDVLVLGPLHLKVRFSDGVEGEIVFRESHLKGVFKPLKDPAFFSLVACDRGFVEWPDEIDLAPDAMYEQIRSHGMWILD